MLDGDFLGEHALAVTYLRLKEHMPAPRDLGRTGTPCFHFNYASKPTLSKYSSLALLVFACNDKYMMLRYNIIQRYIYNIHNYTLYIYIYATHIQNVSAIALFFQDQLMQWGTGLTNISQSNFPVSIHGCVWKWGMPAMALSKMVMTSRSSSDEAVDLHEGQIFIQFLWHLLCFRSRTRP